MDLLTIARALHVLAVLHWIGGVTFVTLVLLPYVTRELPPHERLDVFEQIEGRFANQARVSTLIAGAAGFYLTHALNAWDRFLHPAQFWWMHAMALVWALFTAMLFVAEPLFLHRWFRTQAAHDPDGTFKLVQRMHWVLLSASLLTIAGAMLGAHGGI
jgi:uncharacterized membrane protein